MMLLILPRSIVAFTVQFLCSNILLFFLISMLFSFHSSIEITITHIASYIIMNVEIICIYIWSLCV